MEHLPQEWATLCQIWIDPGLSPDGYMCRVSESSMSVVELGSWTASAAIGILYCNIVPGGRFDENVKAK